MSDQLPERMKANKVVAGRACPACNNTIALGDDVYNCPQCTMTMHYECRESFSGCANPGCAAYGSAISNDMAHEAPPTINSRAEQTPQEDLVPCRVCGENIKPQALKCRYCGEYQAEDESDPEEEMKASLDATLSGGEIAFGILCSTIACIVGLVWGIQGKKKGWKLMGVAAITQVVVTIIRVIIENA